MPPLRPPIFDGHNDVLTRILKAGGPSAADQFLTGASWQIDLPKAKDGGFAGGFFAVWVPSPEGSKSRYDEMTETPYDLPLPDAVPQDDALEIAYTEIAILRRLEALGALKVCTDTAAIRACLSDGTMAAILHMEGAEAIGPDLDELDTFYEAGLRSLGPVWSRPTIFGEGVPFRFPGSPDTGGGLTGAGERLIAKCNAMRIMIDLSHINEAGFWDVARLSTHPLVATHSNVHAICPQARNLTDKQLAAIAESDGMVGLNFAVAFLREDGRMLPDVALDQMLRHLDHLIAILGEDRVGFGSDFDGAVIPQDISDASGLPHLRKALAGHGYDDALMTKLCHGNWLRVLEKTWGA